MYYKNNTSFNFGELPGDIKFKEKYLLKVNLRWRGKKSTKQRGRKHSLLGSA